jgi:transcription elongation factor Elf1
MLKIVIDRVGNTRMVSPRPEMDFNCPFCKAINTYVFSQDAKLFCNNCGKLLVTRVDTGSESIEEYSDEQISDFIRILKEGGSIYDRTDAITSLGKVSRNNKRIGIIINLLQNISISEPEYEVREYAKESLGKLRGIPVVSEVASVEKAVTKEKVVINEKNVINTDKLKEVDKSPFKTYNIEELPAETKQKLLMLNENKTNGKTSNGKTSNGNSKNSKFSMEDDLLSLLSDI